MQINKKKIIIIACVLIIIIGIIVLIKNIINDNSSKEIQTKNDNEIVVNNKKLLKDINTNNLKVVNQTIINTNDTSAYYATLINQKDSEYHIDYLYAIFTVDGSEIVSLISNNITLKPNEERKINISFGKDISRATKIEYRITKIKIEEVNN